MPLYHAPGGINYDVFLARIPEFRVQDDFVPDYETGNTRHLIALPLRFWEFGDSNCILKSKNGISQRLTFG